MGPQQVAKGAGRVRDGSKTECEAASICPDDRVEVLSINQCPIHIFFLRMSSLVALAMARLHAYNSIPSLGFRGSRTGDFPQRGM
jgi:hypothetical protein